MEPMTQIILNVISLLLAWACWHYVWKPSSVYSYRQELFKVRDDLFLKAAKGNVVQFSDPEYQELRMTLNYMIRYAHTTSIMRILAFAVISRQHCAIEGINRKSFFGRKRLAMYNLSDPAKIDLREEVFRNASTALLGHFCRTSLLFWIWVGAAMLIHHSRGFARNSLSIVSGVLKEARLEVDNMAPKPA
jgi:hypothetical protein